MLCFPADTVAVGLEDPRPFMWIVSGELQKRVRYGSQSKQKRPPRKDLRAKPPQPRHLVLSTYESGDSCYALAHIIAEPPTSSKSPRLSHRSECGIVPRDHTMSHELVSSPYFPHTFCLCLPREDYIDILQDEETKLLREIALSMLSARPLPEDGSEAKEARVDRWFELLSLGTFRQVQRGQTIIARGCPINRILIVISGACEVVMTEQSDSGTADGSNGKSVKGARLIEKSKARRVLQPRNASVDPASYRGKPRSREVVVSTLPPGSIMSQECLLEVFNNSAPSSYICRNHPEALGNHFMGLLRSPETGHIRSSYTLRAAGGGLSPLSEGPTLLELDVSLWRKLASIEFDGITPSSRVTLEKELIQVYRQRQSRLQKMAASRLSAARESRIQIAKLRRKRRKGELRRAAGTAGDVSDSSSSDSTSSLRNSRESGEGELVCLKWHPRGPNQELSPAMEKTIEFFRTNSYETAVEKLLARAKQKRVGMYESREPFNPIAYEEQKAAERLARLPLEKRVPIEAAGRSGVTVDAIGVPSTPAIVDAPKTKAFHHAQERTFMTEEPSVDPEPSRSRSISNPNEEKSLENYRTEQQRQERRFSKLISHRMLLVLSTDKKFLKTLKDSVLHTQSVFLALCRSPMEFLHEINDIRKNYDLLMLDTVTSKPAKTTALLEAVRGTPRYDAVPIIALVHPHQGGGSKGNEMASGHSVAPIVDDTCSYTIAKPADNRLLQEAVLWCLTPSVESCCGITRITYT
ncbi:hypothetical protein FOZ60_014239 [Perkinsus olseni]|uniref:Cyclic nucleotide-binding domain-containing protein n=2 Tax=Perkinsus olseni TaxID=32597 RepID=A0A7J6P7L0_PEROL|nr:hypothetical protein FOZ60_014239 [Perkinsus olseni]